MGILTPDELAQLPPAEYVRESDYIVAEANHSVPTDILGNNGIVVELTGQVKIEDDGLVLDVFVDGDPTDATTWVTYAEAGLYRTEDVLRCINNVSMTKETRRQLKEALGLE
jgi:hypothetical protein